MSSVFVTTAALSKIMGYNEGSPLSGYGLAAAEKNTGASLAEGEAISVTFVASEDGAYAEPCTAVCRDGKRGEILFSPLRDGTGGYNGNK